ncbi:MAG: hypothetical protein JNM44_11450 [Chitinophagaceae bacterium]|nr:hypothetical protein [Chitinophagaceae bacterium]
MEKLLASLFLRKPSLALCILLDLVGMASFVLPGLGEWTDLFWAPVSSYLFLKLFGGAGGLLGAGFSFLEELLPFTDILPTFTLAWFLQNKYAAKTSGTPSRGGDIEDAEVIEIR